MKWFYNLRLSAKISILSAGFIFFIIVQAIIGFGAVYRENEKLKILNNQRLIPVYELGRVDSALKSIRLNVLSHILTADAVNQNRLESEIKVNEQGLSMHIDKYATADLSHGKENLESLKKFYGEYQTIRNQIIEMSKNGSKEEAAQLAEIKGAESFDKTVAALNSLIDTQISEANMLYDASEVEYRYTMIGTLAIVALCIILGVALSIMTTRAIVGPVRKVTGKLHEIARNGGDLTQRIGIRSRDEVGQLSSSFDEFVGSLQNIVRDVADSAKTMAESSRQLSDATGESNKVFEQIAMTVSSIAANTSDNVAVTEQTTASLAEAARFSEATAEVSRQTSENSKGVRDAAEKGARQVSDIEESMRNISHSSREVAQVMENLNRSSHKIGEIVQLITNIAEQTNLLALNASIEAARAGEAGRGFNVVADEIRKLADESGRAAKGIVELIRENRAQTENAVATVKEVDSLVSVGVEKASEVKRNIDEIIGHIKEITEQVGEMNNDVLQQSVITQEITKAMHSISANANDMAAGTEEMSAGIEEQVGTMEELEATAHQLSELAARLNDITSGFKA